MCFILFLRILCRTVPSTLICKTILSSLGILSVTRLKCCWKIVTSLSTSTKRIMRNTKFCCSVRVSILIALIIAVRFALHIEIYLAGVSIGIYTQNIVITQVIMIKQQQKWIIEVGKSPTMKPLLPYNVRIWNCHLTCQFASCATTLYLWKSELCQWKLKQRQTLFHQSRRSHW